MFPQFEWFWAEWSRAFFSGDILGVAFMLIPLCWMAKAHLSRLGVWLLLALWVLLFSPDLVWGFSVWAGACALWAVFWAWRYLHCLYAGHSGYSGIVSLLLCAGFTVVTGCLFWPTGLCLTLALAGFSGLHCFLHEREERGVSYSLVSNQAVLGRWWLSWGRGWALPVCLLACLLFTAGAGLKLDWRISLPQMPGFEGQPVGYFTSFHREFLAVWQPVQPIEPGRSGLPLVWPLLLSVRLFLIGLLPVLGILGAGYQVPGRFVYRLLQRPDEELLLFWLCGGALIVATLGHSTARTILENATLAFLLAFWVLRRWWVKRRFSA